MKMRMVIAFLTLCCSAYIAAAAQATESGSQSRIQIRVQAGDTWPGLFGDDWQEVENVNGGDSCWCVGTLLTIPPDVRMTDQTIDRLVFVKDRRDHLRQRLEALTQVGGDIAASAESLHGQLDGVTSLDDLSSLDNATTELENTEIQTSIQESAEVWIIIGGAAFALLVTILLMWAWRNHAANGARRLNAALRMVDRIAG